MKQYWIGLILFVVLLGACTPTATPIVTTLPPIQTAAPSAVPTELPSPTATLLVIASPTAVPLASATPRPQPTVPATAKPGATPEQPGIRSTLVVPDCARFPNFGPCGANLNLTGRLAVFDAQHQLIHILDFQNKTDLVIKPSADARALQWTDQGNTLVTLDNANKPTLAWTNPVLSKLPILPPRSATGALVFTSANGSNAWMEQNNGQFLIHLVSGGSPAEQTWPVEAQPSDKLHTLLGWVPGTNLLLAGYHYSGNSMWITGNSLYTVDARTGAIKDLKVNLRLGGSFAWHPTHTGLLLFGNSSSSPVMGAPQPAVLDVVSGKLTALVADESVASSALAWARNGQTILLAARTVGQAPKPGAPFASAAIYQLDWPGGTSKALTKPAAAEQDDWPQPLPDGKRFLYIHILSDSKTAELRLSAPDSGFDAPVITGLIVNPSAGLSGFQWETQLAYTP